MRAASKVANFAHISGVGGGFRRTPSFPLPENTATTAIPAATKSFPNSEKLITISSQNENIESSSSIQRSSWEFDDWEFTDDRDEFLLSNSKQIIPRVIFGGVPTLEEAKEATSDLKDAFEKKSATVTEESGLELSESEASVTNDNVLAFPSSSKHVFQAFTLLKENPEAQNVVASLAADKNVWNAVMQNEKVMDFLKLQQTNEEFHDDQKTSISFDGENDAKPSESLGDVFAKSMKNLKLSVVEMINNVSVFFQDLFGGQEASNISLDANGNATATNTGRIMGGSFMALVVMTVMVVLLKRA